MCLSCLVAATAEAETDEDYNPTTTTVVLNTLASFLGLCTFCCTFFVVCCVRKSIRRRDNIKSNCCGDGEDCLCALCCNPLAQCQIWRHEGVKWGKNYRLCSPIAV